MVYGLCGHRYFRCYCRRSGRIPCSKIWIPGRVYNWSYYCSWLEWLSYLVCAYGVAKILGYVNLGNGLSMVILLRPSRLEFAGKLENSTGPYRKSILMVA